MSDIPRIIFSRNAEIGQKDQQFPTHF